MSMKSWMHEFYPIPACEIKDAKAALRHSILKWTGLSEENLEKHELRKTPGGVFIRSAKLEMPRSFGANINTCALCGLYYDDCRMHCPISCYKSGRGELAEPKPGCMGIGCLEEYTAWEEHGDNKPMLKLLNDVLNELTGEKK